MSPSKKVSCLTSRNPLRFITVELKPSLQFRWTVVGRVSRKANWGGAYLVSDLPVKPRNCELVPEEIRYPFINREGRYFTPSYSWRGQGQDNKEQDLS